MLSHDITRSAATSPLELLGRRRLLLVRRVLAEQAVLDGVTDANFLLVSVSVVQVAEAGFLSCSSAGISSLCGCVGHIKQDVPSNVCDTVHH